MASTNTRSIVKALTWRAFSIIISALFIYLLTGRVTFALAMLLFDLLLMTPAYYLHERIWKRVKWGKYPTDWTKYGWEKK